MMIIANIVKVLIGVIYLKSSLIKIKKPFQFYKAINGFKMKIHKGILIHLVVILITSEFVLAFCLILPLKSIMFFCLGIGLQIFYLIILYLNLGKHIKDNCDCFSLNAPSTVNIKNIIINLSLLLLIIFLYSWFIRN